MGMRMRLVGLGKRIFVGEGAEGGVITSGTGMGMGGVAMTVCKVVGEGAGSGVG